MKNRPPKHAPRLIGICALGWLALICLAAPPQAETGKVAVTIIRNQASQITGRQLSDAELLQAVNAMTLDFTINRYQPAIDYTSPDEWRVTFTPEKRKGFAHRAPLPVRILFLRLSRMEYPDIVAKSTE